MSIRRILVADDEESIRWVLSKALSKKGFSVDLAVNGSEALTLFRQHPYDMAVLDIKMPGINGLELLSRFLKERPGTMVIIMTAETSMKNAVEAMKRGAYDYITKPFDLDALDGIIYKAQKASEVSEEVHPPQRGDQGPLSARPGHHRFQQADAGGLQGAGQGGALRCYRPHHRGIGHRKGTCGPGHPFQQPPARQAFSRPELRSHPQGASGERTVRLRKGSVHRGHREKNRQVRAGQRRHPFSGRNRRHAPGAAGQAAASPPGEGNHPHRGERRHTGRRPYRGRDQPGSRGKSPGQGVPQRPLLPTQRGSHRPAPPQGTARRPPPAGGIFRPAGRRRTGGSHPGLHRRGSGAVEATTTGRATSGSWKTPFSGQPCSPPTSSSPPRTFQGCRPKAPGPKTTIPWKPSSARSCRRPWRRWT